MALEEGEKEEKGGLAKNKGGAEQDNTAAIQAEVQKQMEAFLAKQNVQVPAGNGTEQMAELVTMFAKKLDQVSGPKSSQFEFNQAHSEIDFDPNDVLPKEEERTFISHKMLYVIVDDKRGGRNIRAPFDKILFDYDSTKRTKDGKETNLLQLSKYTCRSRIELKWLLEHTLFNIMFFDSVKGALSADVERAGVLVRHMTVLQSRGQHELIQAAKGMPGVEFRGDLNMLRAEIANYQTDLDMSSRENNTSRLFQQQMMKDSHKDALAVGHVGA